MVNIFTREITDDLASLVKQIDETVAKNSEHRMAAFVVLLTEDPDVDEETLKSFATKHEIKNTPLTLYDGLAGPPKYKLAEDAAVTVMMWKGRVKVNHAFAKGSLNAKGIEGIVKDTAKILTANTKKKDKKK